MARALLYYTRRGCGRGGLSADCIGLAPYGWGMTGVDWLTHIIADRWFVAFIAFFIGLMTGWLFSSGRKADAEIENGHGDDGDVSIMDRPRNGGAGEPPSMKLDALEAELKNAKALLEAKDEDGGFTSETLASLDEAVKRANGRLKLIMKAVKKAKNVD